MLINKICDIYQDGKIEEYCNFNEENLEYLRDKISFKLIIRYVLMSI